MKYLKTFDSTQGAIFSSYMLDISEEKPEFSRYFERMTDVDLGITGEYWKVELKSKTYLKLASQKIGADLHRIDIDFIFNRMNKIYKNIYLVQYISYDGLIWWRYEFDSSIFKDNIFYNGEIKIPDYEVDAYLYNL